MLSSLHQTISASFRGGGTPRHVALAVGLGLVAGLVTGWNLSLALLVLLAVLLNLNARLFLISWSVGLVMSWLATGLTYQIGRWLLDDTPLGATLGILGDNLWVAFLGWDQYTLAGGAAFGFVLALPAARLAAGLASSSATGDDKNARRWLRPYWLLWASCMAAAIAAAPWRLGPELVKREMLRQLAAANGAAVEARVIRLSLWTGALEIDDLQFADPLRLDRDRLRVGKATARLDAGALLRGRVAADKLSLADLRVDVMRRRAADSGNGAGGGLTLDFARPSLSGAEDAGEDFEIDAYLRNWPEFRERLSWLGRLVSGLEQLAACDSSTESAGEWPGGARSALGRTLPRVDIKAIRAEALPHGWALGQKAVLEISNLVSRPSRAEQVTRLQIVAPELAAEITADLNLGERAPRHKLRFVAYDRQLAELVEPASADRAVTVSAGKLDLHGDGWMTRESIELRLQFEARTLDVRVSSRELLAGVDGAIWDQGLRSLGGFRAEGRLAGPWSAPVLSVNTRRVAEQFKHQLRAAGEHALVQSIDEQLAHPTPPAPPAAEQVAEHPGDDESEAEFCTVTDDAPVETAANPFDGWRRARTTASAPSESAPIQYPRTSAPDWDPADRFLASLEKPNAESGGKAVAARGESVDAQRVQRTQYTSAEPPVAAAPAPPRSYAGNRPLPGPINLVVGRQELATNAGAETVDWARPNRTVAMPYGETMPRKRGGALARWANGVREKLGLAPSGRKSEDLTLPPDLDSPPEMSPDMGPDLGPDMNSDLGEQQYIDQPSEPPAQTRRPWFPAFWR